MSQDIEQERRFSKGANEALELSAANAGFDPANPVFSREPVDLRPTGYPIYFPSVPAIGSQIVYWHNEVLTLVDASPYVRQDGRQSALLTWENEEGEKGVSGLKSKGLTWENGRRRKVDATSQASATPPKHRKTPRDILEELFEKREAPFDHPVINLNEASDLIARKQGERPIGTQEIGRFLSTKGGGNLGRIPMGNGKVTRLWSIDDFKRYATLSRKTVAATYKRAHPTRLAS